MVLDDDGLGAAAALAVTVALDGQRVLAVIHVRGGRKLARDVAVVVSRQRADGVGLGGVGLADQGEGDLLLGGEALDVHRDLLSAVLVGGDLVGAVHVGVVEGDALLVLALLLAVGDATGHEGPAVVRAVRLGLSASGLDQLGDVQRGGPVALGVGGGLHDGGHLALRGVEGDADSRVLAGAAGARHREGGVRGVDDDLLVLGELEGEGVAGQGGGGGKGGADGGGHHARGGQGASETHEYS